MRVRRIAVFAFVALLTSGAADARAAGPLPPQQRENCILAASARYQVPADLVRAVIRTEGGTTGKVVVNSATDGSTDMGLMQINTIHLRGAPHYLERRGITRDLLVNNECLNIHVGTYILSWELARDDADFWTNVGAYNSRTPRHNTRYKVKVWENLQRIRGGK